MNLADRLRNSPLRQRLDERKWEPSRMSYDAHRMRDVPVIGKALQFYDDVTYPGAWSGSGPVFSNEDRQAIDNTPKAEMMERLGNYLPAMDTGGLAGMLKKMPLSKKKWYGGKDPMQLTENEFIKTHKTGTIPSGAYDETDWWGTEIKANPQLIKTIDIPQGQVEFRKSGIKNSYPKMIGDGPNKKVARGDDDSVLYLSDSEIKAKGLPVEDQTITAFFNGEPIGHASNEFGSVGVFLNPKGPRRFHGDSIGTELLTEFMKENPHMQMGRMTHSGERTARKAHKKLTNMMREEQGSRQGGKEASNFVSFADDIAKILERNDQPIGDLAKSLDESLRMGRAKDMGFTVDAYHGTNQDIKTFDPLRRGDVTKARSAKNAFWFADNPDTASGYADLAGSKRVDDLIKESEKAERQGRWDDAHNLMAQAEKLDSVNMNSQNIVPVKLRGKFKDYDAEGKWMQDLEESALADMIEVAKQEGFDGLQLRNFIDEAGYGVHRPATHTAVFNPSNIRSKFAKFDPKKSKSGDILAGAGAGFLASQLMGQDPNERF